MAAPRRVPTRWLPACWQVPAGWQWQELLGLGWQRCAAPAVSRCELGASRRRHEGRLAAGARCRACACGTAASSASSRGARRRRAGPPPPSRLARARRGCAGGRPVRACPVVAVGAGRAVTGAGGAGRAAPPIGTSSVGPAREDHGALDQVLQLADVARPVVARQRLHRLGRDRLDRLLHPPRELLREVAHQHRDVLAPLAQRRHVDREDVEPVEEVLRGTSARRPARRGRGWSRR